MRLRGTATKELTYLVESCTNPLQLFGSTMTLAEIKTKNLDNLEIGARLREAREAQGLSIEKLAKFSGNIPAAIEKLENGEVLSPLVIADLAAILGANAGIWNSGRKRIYVFLPLLMQKTRSSQLMLNYCNAVNRKLSDITRHISIS